MLQYRDSTRLSGMGVLPLPSSIARGIGGYCAETLRGSDEGTITGVRVPEGRANYMSHCQSAGRASSDRNFHRIIVPGLIRMQFMNGVSE